MFRETKVIWKERREREERVNEITEVNYCTGNEGLKDQ